jgi:hypothetical protein
VSARRLALSVMSWLGCMALASCGVPVDEAAEPRPREQIPFDLLDESTTTSPPAGGPAGEETVVCLELEGGLLSVGRAREGPGAEALVALAATPPTPGEARLGLRSSVDRDSIEGVTAADGIATVDLDAEFAELPADRQLLAVAQLTCTLTAQPEASRVRFRLEGERIEVPVQGGALVRRPVTRTDYERLIAN